MAADPVHVLQMADRGGAGGSRCICLVFNDGIFDAIMTDSG